jgi:hypothetical protein
MFTLTIRPLFLRLALPLALAVMLAGLGWFVITAALGDSFVIFGQRSAELDTSARMQAADLAVRFAPRDPLARYRRGLIYLEAATTDETDARQAIALAEMRQAIQLSPEDYRIWIGLGRALDRNGQMAEARAALEQARRLAPNHFDPRWVLGNHLLRAGEREAAFAELRTALATRPSALPLVFDYAWNAYEGDGAALARALSAPAETQPQLAALLIARQRAADGLAVWRQISQPAPAEARAIVQALIGIQRFAAAHEVWRSIPGQVPPLDEGSLLSNGGFERELTLEATAPFATWRLTPGAGVSLALDRQERKSGEQSLRLSFDVPDNPDLLIATQTVTVAPATRYRLSFAARTEELRNLSLPTAEVHDAAGQERWRVESEPIATENGQWRQYQLQFTTAPTTEAVTVRIQRKLCADPPCPLKGRIWFDDFQLRQLAR